MAKKVKMSDIATKLDVSIVTVSKALAGQKGVSEEMRARIIELAGQMGYEKPGEKAANQKSYNIGVIVSEGYIAKYDAFYWDLYQQINSSAAASNSFVMLELISLDDEKNSMPPKLLREGKVDGLIVMGALNTSYLKMIRAHYALPTVYLDFYDSEVQEDSIISNSYYGAYILTNYLIDKGYKRIAFLGTLQATKSINDRYMGYSKALMEKGFEFRRDWLLDDRDMNRVMFTEMPIPEQLPDAIVCNCDTAAARMIESLNKKGFRVPEDVAITGFDDFIHPGLCNVPLTTYSVNMEGLADSAIRNVIRKLSGIETNCGIHLIEGKLVVRTSA